MNSRNIPTLLGFILILLITACTRDDKDPKANLPAKLSIVKGNHQAAFFGEYLPDTLVLQVIPKDTLPANRYFVSYKLTQGNGEVKELNYGYYAPGFVVPNRQGLLHLQWSLGCDVLAQKVVFYLYANSCSVNELQSNQCLPIDSVIFEASARKPKGWSKACGVRDNFSYSSSFTSYQNTLYLVNAGKGYTSTDEGVNWQQFPSSTPKSIRFLECNSKGHLYIVTDDNGLYYSADQARSWTEINTGILDSRYPIALLVEDNTLFVSFHFDGLYRSVNNGKFWKKLLVEGTYGEQYEFITRLPNGDLFLATNWNKIAKSINNGDTWQYQPVDHTYNSGQVTGMTVDHAGHLVIGSEYDGYLAVLSPQTLTGEVVSFIVPKLIPPAQ